MVKLKKTAPTDLDFPTERQVISHDHDLQNAQKWGGWVTVVEGCWREWYEIWVSDG